MNSLLKRQIRKYLPKDLISRKDLEPFLDAIDKSQKINNEQFEMIQRAVSLSSEELSEANKNLRQKAQTQDEIINKLKKVIDTLKFFELPGIKNTNSLELNGSKLADFIDNQAKEIIKINKQRAKLLNNLSLKNQELNDYAHMVSHDLKSPIQNIDTLTSWLKDDYLEKLNEKGEETILLIRKNVEKIDTLINGMLDYSTIDKWQTEYYDVDLNVLLDDILDTIQIPENISIGINHKLPIIKGNKYRLQQLFQNLIENAIKFNDKPNGYIKIGYKDKKNFWKFYIKDNGKGIDKVYHDKIFIIFQKLDYDQNSTGIGLSIVKKNCIFLFRKNMD